jgi:hypothetical protein
MQRSYIGWAAAILYSISYINGRFFTVLANRHPYHNFEARKLKAALGHHLQPPLRITVRT